PCSDSAAGTDLSQGFASVFVRLRMAGRCMCAAMGPATLVRNQLCAYLVSPAPQPTFIPWRRRWQPILQSLDLCWRSIIAVTDSPNTIAITTTTLFELHSPTSRQSWPRSRSLRPYLSARLLVAYLP